MGVNTKSFDNASDMITFSRASGAYGFTKVGYGSELVTNGTFDSDTSGWTPNNLGLLSIDAQRLKVETGSSGSWNYAYQEISVVLGQTYRFQASSVDGTATKHRILLGTTAANGSIVMEGGPLGAAGDKFVDIIFTATTTSVFVTLQNTDGVLGSYTFFDNISIKEVTYNSSDPSSALELIYHPDNVPRIEYNVDGTAKGLLIEEARTNLLLNNSNLYSARNSVLRGFRVSTASVVPASTQLVVSFYLKPKSVSRKEISVDTDAYTFPAIPTTGLPQGVWTRVETEVVTGTGGVQSFLDLQQLTATAPTYTQNSGIAPDGTLTATEITDGTYTYEIWGAQLEEGSFATSFIETTGTTATRAVDVASIGVSKFGYNQTEGTVVVEASTKSTADVNHNDLNIKGALDLKIVSSGSRVGGSAAGTYSIYSPTTSVLANVSSVVTQNSTYKAAYALADNDVAISVNGSSVASDTSTSITSLSAVTVEIGDGYGYLNGHIKSIKYYPRRLTDAQLQELTT
jgi:hypothetical protein